MKNILAYAALVAAVILIVEGVWYALTFHGSAKNTLPAAAVVPQEATTTKPAVATVVESPEFHYIEIVGGCDWSYAGPCVNMRLGPSVKDQVVTRLRIGVVLKVEATTTMQDGLEWYKIIFDGDIRYPDRVAGDWYVVADPESVRPFTDVGDSQLTRGTVATTSKRIVVSLSKETLYAYDGDTLFMQEPISTGLEFTPTPPGTFKVYKKTPSRYMQGPIPEVSDQFYDLPGVPWDLYFTYSGAVIHGAYWHDKFGQPWSHGCVNLSPQNAKELYEWADLGTPVLVQN